VTNSENSGVITTTPSSEKRGIRSTVRKATKEETEEDKAAKNRCGRCGVERVVNTNDTE
jgi:hypothetical protein